MRNLVTVTNFFRMVGLDAAIPEFIYLKSTHIYHNPKSAPKSQTVPKKSDVNLMTTMAMFDGATSFLKCASVIIIAER